MKCLMSINPKFMEFSPKDLVELIKENSNYVDGFEVYINIDEENQIDYLKELSHECKKNNLHFQVHGESTLPIKKQKKYFNILNEISDYLKNKINVVIHPITCDTILNSIEATTKYIEDLLSIVDLNKVIISLENLNDYEQEDRLSTAEVLPIIANNDDLYFTYDIGHEIAENGYLTNIDKVFIPKISNVHIHTVNSIYSDGYDHKPIYKDDKYWNDIITSLNFLKINHYKKSIVFEYDLYVCPGENLSQKIISYAKSIEFVAERIK